MSAAGELVAAGSRPALDFTVAGMRRSWAQQFRAAGSRFGKQ